MPTILKKDGFRFFFFSNENQEPPHIHVSHGDGYAKIWLHPPSIENSVGLKPSQLSKILILVKANEKKLTLAWYDYFSK